MHNFCLFSYKGMSCWWRGPFNYPKDGKRHNRWMKDVKDGQKNTTDRQKTWQKKGERDKRLAERHERPQKTYSHGNYTLAHDFAAFTVTHAVWQAKGQEDKDAAFGNFVAYTVRRKWTVTVTLCWLCQRGQTLPESRVKERAHALRQPSSSNYTISSQLVLSRLPLFEQDIKYYVCHYHSVNLFSVSSIHTDGSCWNVLQL